MVGDLHHIEPRDDPSNGLTCIHTRIHCAATHGHEDGYSESYRIVIDQFLHTLAEVALAVASRRARQENDESA